MPSPTPLSLTARALRLLSAREHSRAELQRKLARFEEVPGTLAQTLDTLTAKNFISEARVLASVVHRRSAKLGSLRIGQELHAKGLEPEAIAQALDALRDTELSRAHAIWVKKFGVPAADARERGKQMRFLLARGFASATAYRVVGAQEDDWA